MEDDTESETPSWTAEDVKTYIDMITELESMAEPWLASGRQRFVGIEGSEAAIAAWNAIAAKHTKDLNLLVTAAKFATLRSLGSTLATRSSAVDVNNQAVEGLPEDVRVKVSAFHDAYGVLYDTVVDEYKALGVGGERADPGQGEEGAEGAEGAERSLSATALSLIIGLIRAAGL